MEEEKKPVAEETKNGKRLRKAGEYQGQAIAAFIVIAAAVLVYFVLLRFQIVTNAIKAILHALSPAIWGFAFAFVLTPVVRFFEKRCYRLLSKRAVRQRKIEKYRKLSRNLSVFVTLMITITCVVLLLIAVIPEFIESINNLVNELPGYVDSITKTISGFLSRNKRISGVVMPYLNNMTTYIEEFLQKYLENIVSTAANWVSTGIIVVFRVCYNLLIGLIISVYLMSGKEYYIGLCKKIVFAVLPKRKSQILVTTMYKANDIFSSAILGKILDSIIIGCLCFIGTTVLGIFFPTIGSYTVLVSIIVGVTNVIPFFGPYIGGIPCIVLIMCMNPLHGLIFAAFILVLQQFDCNYLDPHIVGRKVGLKPLFVLTACLLGGSLFGVLGLVVAVPTFALVYSILKSYFEVRLEAKNLPKDTSRYVTTPGAYLVRDSEAETEKGEETVNNSDIE